MMFLAVLVLALLCGVSIGIIIGIVAGWVAFTRSVNDELDPSDPDYSGGV